LLAKEICGKILIKEDNHLLCDKERCKIMRNKTRNRLLSVLFFLSLGFSLFLIIAPHIKKLSLVFYPEGMSEMSINVGMAFITILTALFAKVLHRPVIRAEIYCRDKYFVDRETERKALFVFLSADSGDEGSLFFVKGGMCRGKTELLQRFADDVNQGRKSELAKQYPQSRSYSAYYISLHCRYEDIAQEISNCLLGDNRLIGYGKISTFLRKASYRRKCVLLIDNINKAQSYSITEAAHALLYNNPYLKIILAITEESSASKNNASLIPPLFGEIHISALANAYKIPLRESKMQEIIRISNGIPSYVRMIFHTKALDSSTILSNIENIQQIVNTQLNQLDKDNHIVAFLACLELCNGGTISKKELLQLTKASEPQLEQVYDAALAREDGFGHILMDALVARCCRKTIRCDEFLDEIYHFYISRDPYSDIAFTAQLMLASSSQHLVTEEALTQKYMRNGYLLFAHLDYLDEENQIRAFETIPDLYNKFRYFCLSSLLQLGEYSQAFTTLKRYENSQVMLPSLREAYTPSGFEMQYLIIDLHHLSNRFTLALGEIEAILSQNIPLAPEHSQQLLYLKAHCLKHLGNQLEEADQILKELEDATLPTNFRIKVLSSRLAIHLFQGTHSSEYRSVEQRINSLTEEIIPEKLHAVRHFAYLHWKISGSAEKALETINNGLEILERTRWRIIYDFYFEKAEWMRIDNIEKGKTVHETSTILSYYRKAIAFASENQDINLQCSAQLGIILTQYEENSGNATWRKDQLEIVYKESKKMEDARLAINRTYAEYVKTLLSGESCCPEFIDRCKKNGFDNLYQHLKTGTGLKLTVM